MDQRTTTFAVVAGVAAVAGLVAVLLSRRRIAADKTISNSTIEKTRATSDVKEEETSDLVQFKIAAGTTELEASLAVDEPAQPDDEDSVLLGAGEAQNVTKRRRSRGFKKNKSKKADAAAAAETTTADAVPTTDDATSTSASALALPKIEETEEVALAKVPENEFDMSVVNVTIKDLTTRASAAFDKEQYTVALDCYQQALNALPPPPTKPSSGLSQAMTEAMNARKVILCNRAAVYEQRGDVAQALSDCNTALHYDPFHPTALMRRARICYALRNPEQAAADLTRIINLSQTYENYVDAETVQSCGSQLEALLSGIAKEESDALLKAKLLERPGIEALPANALVMPFYYSFAGEREHFVADASEMKTRGEELVIELESAAVGTDEGVSDVRAVDQVRFELAFVRKYQRQLRESALLFQEIVEAFESGSESDNEEDDNVQLGNSSSSSLTNEQMARCFEELSSIYHLCTNVSRAAELIDRAVLLNPTRVPALIKAAEVQLELENKEASQALLARAVVVNEEEEKRIADAGKQASSEEKQVHKWNVANYHFHKATFTLFEAASSAPAESSAAGLPDMLLAIEICPSFAVAHMYTGVAHFHSGKSEMAIESLEKSCALAPELFQTHTYLGEIFMELSKLDESDAKYNDAIEADPTSAMPYVNKGTIKATLFQQTDGKDMKLFAEALRFFNRAIQVDPNCGVALLRTAVLYSFVGKPKLALKKLNQAVDLAKNKTEMEEFCMYRASCSAQILATELQYKPSPSSARYQVSASSVAVTKA